MAIERGGGAGSSSPTPTPDPTTTVALAPTSPPPLTPSAPLPNSIPIVPVAGVSVADLVDSFGVSRDGGARAHKGIDIFSPMGTPVLSTVTGQVVAAGNSNGKAGLRVWVQGDDGRFHFFAHLSAVHVAPGTRVSAGQVLGRVGDSGNAKGTPPHLHYSVNTRPFVETGDVNPFVYLRTGQAAPASADLTLAYSTHPWTPADLTLPSDDDGDLDTPTTPLPTAEDLLRDSLIAMSYVFAGGEITPFDAFPTPVNSPVTDTEEMVEDPDSPDHSHDDEGGE